ncbi:MAG: rhomboid family intramembrane serine protease [Pseudomonadota bacterium]
MDETPRPPPGHINQPVFNDMPVLAVALALGVIATHALSQFGMGREFFLLMGVVVAGPDEGRAFGGVHAWFLHVFVHGGWLHAGINAAAILAFGAAAARPFSNSALGAFGFLAFFFTCALAGALAHEAVHWNEGTAMVGASTAASGLIAAAGWVRGGLAGMARLAVPWALINVALAVIGGFASTGLAWAAHLGGLAAGAALYPVFLAVFSPRRR